MRFTLENIALLAEGPLMEGSNTAQGVCQDALAAFLKANNLKIEQLASIRVVKAELAVADSISFDLIRSVTLQFASDQAEMAEAGVLNPIPSGTKSVSLQVPKGEKDLLPTLRQPSFSVVADLDIKQDTSINFPLTGKFEFEASVR